MKINFLHKLLAIACLLAIPMLNAGAQDMKIGSGTTVKILPSTYITASSDVEVDAGGSLEIAGFATIIGNVSSTDAAGILVRSSETNDGSFIFGGGSPFATIQRYVPNSQNWHQIGVPLIAGATTNNFYFNGNPGTWLMRYIESTDDYEFIQDLSDVLYFAEGFVMLVDGAPATVSFEGEISPANLSLNASSTPAIQFSSVSYGYNLIANPYSSPIEFDNSWTLTNMEGSIWILDQAGGQGNYRNRTTAGAGSLTDGIIPLGQAFFVRATATSPALTIPADKRTHHGQAFYKSTQDVNSSYEHYLTIRVNEHQSWDEIMVSFGQNASEGFDNGFDCSKMMGDEKAPQLYLSESQVENLLSINHLPLLTHNQKRIVDMGFIPGQEGEQHFRATFTNMDNFSVTLEDLKENVFHNLTENPLYSFQSVKTDDEARFKLHFYDVTSLDDQFELSNTIKVYSHNKQVYVQPLAENTNAISVIIVDVLGKPIYRAELPANSLSRINLSHVPNNVVVVHLLAGNRVETSKVLLHE